MRSSRPRISRGAPTRLSSLFLCFVCGFSHRIFSGIHSHHRSAPLVLAAGSNTGVVLGMGAFAAGGVPIGVVSEVTADFSRVTLFSSPSVRTSGWVGQADLPLTIIGEGAGAMSATIARGESVIEGDKVFASGPGMLPIGTVARIDSAPSTPSMTLRIMPAQNLFSIAWVMLRDTRAALLP